MHTPSGPLRIAAPFCALALLTSHAHAAPKATPKPGHTEPAQDLDSTIDGNALRGILHATKYHYITQVKTAYLHYARAQALREIAAAGKSLPQDFLGWIDMDPIVQETVYGARQKASNVLLMLRSLELDLGQKAVRQQYTQLALAMAVVEAANGPTADLTPRQPIQLVIPGDPRKPVDTHAKDRPLDVNDHIINFLEDHAPIDGDTFGAHERPPELKYDSKGVAIMDTAKVAKGTPAKVKRAVLAADVIESAPLQKEFNAYMQAHGQSVRIDCGDHVISPNQHEMIKGPYADGIMAAYKLLRAAYEAKGRLPAARDTLATPAERCAFLIRNDQSRLSGEIPKRKWPQFPLTAPWPTLTLLAAASEPLREREEIWRRFVDTGEMIGYGEYIDGIAQQFDFQSARRLSPYPFTYGTFQMMLKDGGVCGTMANMGVRTHTALGVPACTAGQPGHCALISWSFDEKTRTYVCHGEQYATGGDDDTHPHVNWVFGDTDERRDMAWYQSVAYGVNAGFQSYLDSMIALDIYRALSDAERKEYGLTLLSGGLDANPYNIALVEAAVKGIPDYAQGTAFVQHFNSLFVPQRERPGCPVKGLYIATAGKLTGKPLAALKPAGKEVAIDGRASVEQIIAREGLPAAMLKTKGAFAAYLGTNRNEKTCESMTQVITAVAEKIADKQQQATWAAELGALVDNREFLFETTGHVAYDGAVETLIHLGGYKGQSTATTLGLLQREIIEQVSASVSGPRDEAMCRQLAAKISGLGACMDKFAPNPAMKSSWLAELGKIMSGKETFLPSGARPGSSPITDPCVAVIKQLAGTRS
jgi:hypothetical protein